MRKAKGGLLGSLRFLFRICVPRITSICRWQGVNPSARGLACKPGLPHRRERCRCDWGGGCPPTHGPRARTRGKEYLFRPMMSGSRLSRPSPMFPWLQRPLTSFWNTCPILNMLPFAIAIWMQAVMMSSSPASLASCKATVCCLGPLPSLCAMIVWTPILTRL